MFEISKLVSFNESHIFWTFPLLVNKMSSWLEGVEVEVRDEVSSLLKDILNLQGVSGVRQGIWSLLQEYSPYKQWSTATQVYPFYHFIKGTFYFE